MKIILKFTDGEAIIDWDGTIHADNPVHRSIIEAFMKLHPAKYYLPHPWEPMVDEILKAYAGSGKQIVSGNKKPEAPGAQPLIY